ncbi:MAG: AAA family ATPase [Saprospiraceae bacterium]|nr:AAA family ATPase [Saprospiraceae bacterium]
MTTSPLSVSPKAQQISDLVQLPTAPDLEAAVLGAMLIDTTICSLVKTIFKDPYVFSIPKYRLIFQACLHLDKQNKPIDLLTVYEDIKRRGKTNICQPSELTELTNKVGSAANTEYHARILYQTYMRRVAIRQSIELIESAGNHSKDIFLTYATAYKALKKSDPSGILRVSTVNDAIATGARMEQQKQLIGALLRERDLAILFGDEGTGKSILSYQIGDAVSKGKDLFGIDDLRNECPPKSVIMFDFEMMERELFDRYSTEGTFYSFSENFYRANMDDSWTDMENLADKIVDHIEVIIKSHKPHLAIIDNLTWICDETTDNTIAARVMKKLDALRKQFPPLAILVIAHTPKRDKSQPLESRHLAGAKSLSNFCTSLFAISESMRDPGIRYVKHLKCRGAAKVYTGDNVLELTLIKETAKLEFEYASTSAEQEHLQYADLEDKEQAINDLTIDLVAKKYSFRRISQEIEFQFGVKFAHTTLSRRYRRLAPLSL